MGQVTATEVCRTAAEGWPYWRQNCSQRRGCVHMCSDNPSAASQNAGPMQQQVDVETLSGPVAFLLLCCLNSFLILVLLNSEGWREWHSRVREAGRCRLQILAVKVVKVVRCCWFKARDWMLLLVASNSLESLPDRAGILWKELAFDFAPVVGFRSPYRFFDTVLAFLYSARSPLLKASSFCFSLIFRFLVNHGLSLPNTFTLFWGIHRSWQKFMYVSQYLHIHECH